MKRKVTIKYEGGNGSFDYISNAPDLYLAVSVATKEMFKRCIWLDPKTTRIDDVQVEHYIEPSDDDEPEGHYEGGPA